MLTGAIRSWHSHVAPKGRPCTDSSYTTRQCLSSYSGVSSQELNVHLGMIAPDLRAQGSNIVHESIAMYRTCSIAKHIIGQQYRVDLFLLASLTPELLMMTAVLLADNTGVALVKNGLSRVHCRPIACQQSCCWWGFLVFGGHLHDLQ